jgi:hypothetical protein
MKPRKTKEERKSPVSKYAVYASSRIYHTMLDEQHTSCGVQVFASTASNTGGGQAQNDWSVLKIMESVPEGLRLCQHCSVESVKK